MFISLQHFLGQKGVYTLFSYTCSEPELILGDENRPHENLHVFRLGSNHRKKNWQTSCRVADALCSAIAFNASIFSLHLALKPMS